MRYLCFSLEGDIALWRNPYVPVGSYSSLGPSPSQIAGMVGASLGFSSSRMRGATNIDDKEVKRLYKKGLYWPVSEELLRWQEENEYSVAVRWCGGFPRRINWNVNGYKELRSQENLRLIQTVVESPRYEVLIRLNDEEELKRVGEKLINPEFPLFLGASFCRAIVKHVELTENIPSIDEGSYWAYWVENLTIGETVPFSRHVINAKDSGERILSEGYWIYPTPMHSPPQNVIGEEAIVTGYTYTKE